MAVKAKEQLDKQTRLVNRLRKEVDELDRQLRERRIELANEEKICNYYAVHPALERESDTPESVDQKMAAAMEIVSRFNQPMLDPEWSVEDEELAK
jgi:hypothetical protein